MSSNTDYKITDIGGVKFESECDNQVRQALCETRHDGTKIEFPKEKVYQEALEEWDTYSHVSYQTSDEMKIIQLTAAYVVKQMPSGTSIIDLGAANSDKYEPYIEEFHKQGKKCAYIPLDIQRKSLINQLKRAKSKFPDLECEGLFGSFADGDAHFHKISGPRLFLSLGSIFLNGPKNVVADRCKQFRRHMSPDDRLIIGQDEPSKDPRSHLSYSTEEFKKFFRCHLKAINKTAGIIDEIEDCWSYDSKMQTTKDENKHYFEVIAKDELVCTKYDKFKVPKGQKFDMFTSWKVGEEKVRRTVKSHGLDVETLQTIENSSIKQYLIKNSS